MNKPVPPGKGYLAYEHTGRCGSKFKKLPCPGVNKQFLVLHFLQTKLHTALGIWKTSNKRMWKCCHPNDWKHSHGVQMAYNNFPRSMIKPCILLWCQFFKYDTLFRSWNPENDTLFSHTSPYKKTYECPHLLPLQWIPSPFRPLSIKSNKLSGSLIELSRSCHFSKSRQTFLVIPRLQFLNNTENSG